MSCSTPFDQHRDRQKSEVVEEDHGEEAGERQFQQEAGKAHHEHAGEMGATIGLGRELGRGLDYKHGFGQ